MYKWDAGKALELIERERATDWTGVPTMVQDLMEHPVSVYHIQDLILPTHSLGRLSSRRHQSSCLLNRTLPSVTPAVL